MIPSSILSHGDIAIKKKITGREVAVAIKV